MYSIESIDTDILDEINDIYPCKSSKCDKYHKSKSKYQALIDAVYFLKPERVKQLLENFNEEEINNEELQTFNYKNFLCKTISSITGTCGVGIGIPTTQKIGVYAFRCGVLPNQIIGAKLFLEIIELICSKFPQLVNKDAYLIPNSYNIIPLIELLNKYYIGSCNDKTCLFCRSKSKEQILNIPCLCKDTFVHLHCLIKKINSDGDQCENCSGNYGSHICPKGRVNFPK